MDFSDTPVKTLPYSAAGSLEIVGFINNHYEPDYTLSLYDSISGQTLEIDNPISDLMEKHILKFLNYFSTVEHTFFHWIGKNDLSQSYVISMDFTRGELLTNSFYHIDMKTHKLKRVL